MGFEFFYDKDNRQYQELLDWGGLSVEDQQVVEKLIAKAYDIGRRHGFNVALCRVHEKINELEPTDYKED